MKSPRTRYALLAAFAAFVLSPAMNWIHDMLFYPWAHADPALFDRWAGRFTAGNGDRLDLVLVLHRRLESDGTVCARCNQIEGTAITCDARGTVRRYDIAGSPKDRGGHHLHIGAIPAQSPPPDGLELDTLIGTWDGADALTLKAGFFGVAARAASARQMIRRRSRCRFSCGGRQQRTHRRVGKTRRQHARECDGIPDRLRSHPRFGFFL